MANTVPNSLLYDMATGAIIIGTHTFYLMMLDNSYTPSKSHTRRSNLTANEVSGTNYSAGGKVIVPTIALVGNEARITFPTVTWTSVNGFTAAHAACYRLTGSGASSDPVVGIGTFASAKAANGLDFQVNFSSLLVLAS